MGMIEAGGIPETFFTVWTNVFDRGRLQPGESFLVHGGSSGIGTTAIQLAHAFGATVFATVGGEDKRRACLELGAKRVIDYRNEDFVEVVRAETGGKGVDVILDMVGGPYVERNLQALAVEGRLVQIAWLQGPKVQANFMPLMLKRLTWTGSTLRPRSVEQKGEIAQALEARVWPLLAEGKVRPLIHRTFPLERGGGRPRADGIEHAYRQDRARDLSRWPPAAPSRAPRPAVLANLGESADGLLSAWLFRPESPPVPLTLGRDRRGARRGARAWSGCTSTATAAPAKQWLIELPPSAGAGPRRRCSRPTRARGWSRSATRSSA